MNQQSVIVAVEGPCCAGKTTLSRGLLKRLTDVTIAHVRCYADFVGGGRFLPNAVPTTLNEDMAGLRTLIKIELARTASALNSQSDLVLMDRGVNTLLAHRYAIERVTGLECFAPAQRLVAASGLPSWPDLVIYLDVSKQAVSERNNGKFPEDSIFINPGFNAAIRSYFGEVARQQPLVWIDATLEPSEVLRTAEESVRKLLGGDHA